jgi:hypothetical protein
MKQHEYEGIGEYLTGKTELLGKISAPVLLCPPQISHEVPGTIYSAMMNSRQLKP